MFEDYCAVLFAAVCVCFSCDECDKWDFVLEFRLTLLYFSHKIYLTRQPEGARTTCPGKLTEIVDA